MQYSKVHLDSLAEAYFTGRLSAATFTSFFQIETQKFHPTGTREKDALVRSQPDPETRDSLLRLAPLWALASSVPLLG